MNDINLIIIGVIAGLITGLSGVLMGSFTIFFTAKAAHKQKQKHAVANSMLTLMYMTLLVLIVGLLIASFIDSQSVDNTQAISIAMPLLATLLGLSLVRRYFWNKPLIAITHHKQHMSRRLKQQDRLIQPLMAAASLVYASSPIILANCILLAILGILSNGSALYWSVGYAIGLITPLYTITALLSNKTNPAHLLRWQDTTKNTTFLYIGLWCIFLAWLVLYYVIVNGAYIV